MVTMSHKSRSSSKLSPREVSELLRNFYQPEAAGIEDFDSFYAELDSKLDQEEPSSKIKMQRLVIEDQYTKREEDLKRRLKDINLKKPKTKSMELTAKLLVTALAALLVLGLASFAGYKYAQRSPSSSLLLQQKK